MIEMVHVIVVKHAGTCGYGGIDENIRDNYYRL